MERSSGLKECPRCGLRNRRGANQCDFCGWDFKAASDDWMGKVSDLERMKQEVEVSTLDRSTRSKIELTIKKPGDLPAPRERKAEKQLEVPAHLALDDRGDAVARSAAEESYPEAELEAVPEAQAVDEPLTAPVEGIKAGPVDAPPEAAVTVEEEITTRDLSPLVVPAGLLSAGVVMYGIDLYLTSTHAINRVLGWGIVIVASMIMAFAMVRILPLLRGRGATEEETILCPVCHEVVSENDAKCPSCGVKFKDSSARD